MEILVAFAAISGGWSWFTWWRDLATVNPLASNRSSKVILAIVPGVLALGVAATLLAGSSTDVRDDVGYLAFYLVLGAGWVGAVRWAIPLMGVSPRDDVLDRSNPAALWVILGALAGITCCYAGGNVGNGPGPEVVIFSALLATAALFFAWSLLSLFVAPDLLDQITIDRDSAVGRRLAGFLTGTGIIFGYSVAGDWTGMENTVKDFALYGSPALALLGAELVLRILRSGRGDAAANGSDPSRHLAVIYLVSSVFYVLLRTYSG